MSSAAQLIVRSFIGSESSDWHRKMTSRHLLLFLLLLLSFLFQIGRYWISSGYWSAVSPLYNPSIWRTSLFRIVSMAPPGVTSYLPSPVYHPLGQPPVDVSFSVDRVIDERQITPSLLSTLSDSLLLPLAGKSHLFFFFFFFFFFLSFFSTLSFQKSAMWRPSTGHMVFDWGIGRVDVTRRDQNVALLGIIEKVPLLPLGKRKVLLECWTKIRSIGLKTVSI